MLSIYKASAGSGKTFTLAYEYIKMLLGECIEVGKYRLETKPRFKHRSILAITFTNKATDEMKRRIVHELAVLAHMEPDWKDESDYRAKLIETFGCTSEELTKAAGVALRQLLFDFHFFQVSTIDVFFQSILRTFAREADLAGDYQLEINGDVAISYGIDGLFDSLKTSNATPEKRRSLEWITNYLLNEINEGRSISLFNRNSSVHNNFLKFISKISNEEFVLHYDALMNYLSEPTRIEGYGRDLAKHIAAMRKQIKDAAANAIAVIDGRPYMPLGWKTEKGEKKPKGVLKKTPMNVLRACAETGIIPEGKTFEGIYNDVNYAFDADLVKYLKANPDPVLTDAIRDAVTTAAKCTKQIEECEMAQQSIFSLGILRQIYSHIDEYRSENNTILLSDTNGLLRTIIGDDDAPFVYERMGIWLKHFLIDEFQDTSSMQWQNLRPLLTESLSTKDGESLIIGDEKQCIYRFRSSDPNLLQHQVSNEDFPRHSHIIGDTAEGNTNWRSAAGVVKFNNEIFTSIASDNGFSSVYANVRQQVAKKNAKRTGYVSARGIEATKDDEYDRLTIDRHIEIIRRQLKSGYRPCDIMILVRMADDAIPIIERIQELRLVDPDFADVRVMSDESMKLESAISVRLILSVLRFIAMPRRFSDNTEVKEHPSMTEFEIAQFINRFEYAISQGMSADEALEASVQTDSKNIADSFHAITEGMTCYSVISLVERIIAHYITPFAGFARDENMFVSAFCDVVAEYCSTGTPDLESFLAWWDMNGAKQTISIAHDERAIHAMTIHKSKGLEFPCVHIPFINWDIIKFKDPEWFKTEGMPFDPPVLLPIQPKASMKGTAFENQYKKRYNEQFLDELNVLYVAFTRAVDELILTYRDVNDSENTRPTGAVVAKALKAIAPDQDPKVGVEFGEPTTPRDAEEKQLTAVDPRHQVFMEPIYSLDRKDLWSDTKLKIPDMLSARRKRGILLHNIMSRVDRPESLGKAIHRYMRLGSMAAERDEVTAHLQSQLARPEVRPWFVGYKRLVCERSVIFPNGETYRPDRVIWTADGHVDVVDYKFGEPNNTKYAKQVANYMDILESAGYENVRGFIWYVDSGEILRVERQKDK